MEMLTRTQLALRTSSVTTLFDIAGMGAFCVTPLVLAASDPDLHDRASSMFIQFYWIMVQNADPEGSAATGIISGLALG